MSKITIEHVDGRLSVDLGGMSQQDAISLLKATLASLAGGKAEKAASSILDKLFEWGQATLADVMDPTCTICSQPGHLSFQCQHLGKESRVHFDDTTATLGQCQVCGSPRGVQCS